MKRRHLLTLPLLALFVFVGCSSKSASGKVSGKVTYNGAPVTGGGITFHYDTNTYPGVISADGSFEVVDIPAGEAIVTVDTEMLKDVKQVTYTGQSSGVGSKYAGKGVVPPGGGGSKGKKGEVSPAGEGSPQGASGAYMKIPKAYTSKTTSNLKAKITGGSQTLNFELTD